MPSTIFRVLCFIVFIFPAHIRTQINGGNIYQWSARQKVNIMPVPVLLSTVYEVEGKLKR